METSIDDMLRHRHHDGAQTGRHARLLTRYCGLRRVAIVERLNAARRLHESTR